MLASFYISDNLARPELGIPNKPSHPAPLTQAEIKTAVSHGQITWRVQKQPTQNTISQPIIVTRSNWLEVEGSCTKPTRPAEARGWWKSCHRSRNAADSSAQHGGIESYKWGAAEKWTCETTWKLKLRSSAIGANGQQRLPGDTIWLGLANGLGLHWYRAKFSMSKLIWNRTTKQKEFHHSSILYDPLRPIFIANFEIITTFLANCYIEVTNCISAKI